MHSHIISARLATAKVDEESRLARERQRRAVHARQRSLVRASLLQSADQSAPRGGRSLPSEG